MKKGRPLAYTRITYEDLGLFVGSMASIPVSKNWLDAITGGAEEPAKIAEPESTQTQQNNSKIEYELTEFE